MDMELQALSQTICCYRRRRCRESSRRAPPKGLCRIAGCFQSTTNVEIGLRRVLQEWGLFKAVNQLQSNRGGEHNAIGEPLNFQQIFIRSSKLPSHAWRCALYFRRVACKFDPGEHLPSIKELWLGTWDTSKHSSLYFSLYMHLSIYLSFFCSIFGGGQFMLRAPRMPYGKIPTRQ